MEPTGGAELRSTLSASESGATALDSLQFTDEICRLISVPQDNASSFTALLELPAPQAVELLHSPESTEPFPSVAVKPPDIEDFKRSFHLPANSWLIEGAAKFSALDGEHSSPVTSSNGSGPSPAKEVKSEPVETVSSQPLVSDPTIDKKPNKKRKEWEKKAKDSSKKSKGAADDCTGETEKLPYVHVRARRGQATDSHSLAERARREKINARMKLLQELVPGCNKISGTALILDEIINHVQCLQRQVEFLSMRLAAANPRIDFNLDSICAAEGGAAMCSNFPSMFMPLMWPEVQVNGNHQQYQPEWQFEALEEPVWGRGEICHNYVTPENSLMSYDSSTNSATLQSNRMKMES